jgi:hypothetical protein
MRAFDLFARPSASRADAGGPPAGVAPGDRMLMPLLSRGKHRNPRKGACFMEMASYLAGERWTDHPSCTHPLLASLARHVNDATSDAARPRLATLIPSVIGLTGDDVRVDVRIALRCAQTALPVAPEDRQRVLAVSVLTCERALSALPDGGGAELRNALAATRELVPETTARWASQFAGRVNPSPGGFSEHAAPHAVRIAVDGIVHSACSDPDAVLRGLLADAIEDCRTLLGGAHAAEDGGGQTVAGVEPEVWARACRLTGAGPLR